MAKKKKIILSLTALVLVASVTAQADNAAKAMQLVNKMTLEEKVNLVVGVGMKIPGMTNGALVGQTMDKVAGAAGTTFSIDHLGIPTTVVADGPAGLRIEPRRKDDKNTYYATAFPVGTLLASTWDTKLVKELGVAMGNEVKEYGVDVLLGPGLNIQRNPLGGRNFEYFSENPLISGNIAAAMVNGIQSNGVGTSIKHFALNNQEQNRNTVNVIVSERAMREIYLKGFEIAVKESIPWTVMSSYNKWNGTYTSEEYDLLTTILRKEWGFKGLVMTDWFGGKDAVAQMKAGNDLLMPGTPQQKKAIQDAVRSGALDIKILDENAGRIAAYVLGTHSYKKYAFSNKPDLKAHAAVVRNVAANGMILLKNETAALPIAKSVQTIAVFGNTAYDFISGGTGSGDVKEEYTISLVAGLSNAGYKVDSDLKGSYEKYLSDYKAQHPKKDFFAEFMNPTPRPAESVLDAATISKSASEADFALITIGRNAGEGDDRKLDNDFNLSTAEKGLIKDIAAAFHATHKKVVVVVLNVGAVIEVASWRNEVDAILLSWQPGMEAGNSVADVLSGKVNPSGKLAVTFPAKYEDEPSAKNFPGKEFPEHAEAGMFGMKQMPAEVIYEEGIYVGYRYCNSFKVTPAFEFGCGISYTHFAYSNLILSAPTFNGKMIASVTITNTGKVAGKEVVQLYISAPANKLAKPAEELKAFAKTELLQPGKSQTIRFVIEPRDLTSFDTSSTSWIAEAGKYTVKVAASSLDIKQIASFSLPKELIVEKCNKVLVPQVEINELKK